MKFLQAGVVLLTAVLILIGCSSTGKTKTEGTDKFGKGAGGPEIGKYSDGSGGDYGAADVVKVARAVSPPTIPMAL